MEARRFSSFNPKRLSVGIVPDSSCTGNGSRGGEIRLGRKPTSKELRELIFRMVAENPTWGAPRIHGELRMLGFGISERTVLHWMRKAPRSPEPARRWATFLGQSPRSHCRHGLLHSANADLWCALLLLRYRPRPASSSSFQRDSASNKCMGVAATARSVSLRYRAVAT